MKLKLIVLIAVSTALITACTDFTNPLSSDVDIDSGINQNGSGINQNGSGINQNGSGINQNDSGINQNGSGINQNG